MSLEVKPEIRLEIGRVLFIDIVGYSKLLITNLRAVFPRVEASVAADRP